MKDLREALERIRKRATMPVGETDTLDDLKRDMRHIWHMANAALLAHSIPERGAALAELSAKATPGPWAAEKARTLIHIAGPSPVCEISVSANHVHEDYPGCRAEYVAQQEANAAFIVAAVNYVRALLSIPAPVRGVDMCLPSPSAPQESSMAGQAGRDVALPEWQDISTAPRDETVLVTVVPTEANESFLNWKPTTHPAYIDDERHICDAGSWKPEPGLNGSMWRTTHWMPLPAPHSGEPMAGNELSREASLEASEGTPSNPLQEKETGV
jgi:hypothetical protein